MIIGKIHRKIWVTGRVQGVFYRATAMDKALELGLLGFVQNMPDGHVYIEVEGSQAGVESLISWCKKGSAFSRVETVSVEEGDVIGYLDFSIKR